MKVKFESMFKKDVKIKQETAEESSHDFLMRIKQEADTVDDAAIKQESEDDSAGMVIK